MSQCGHVPNGTRTLFDSSSYEYLHGIRILNLLEKKIVNLIEDPHFLVTTSKKFHEFFRLFELFLGQKMDCCFQCVVNAHLGIRIFLQIESRAVL